MALQMLAVVKNPFTIFPEEAWELILDHLDNIHDIKNAFKAFPQLQILLQGKHFSWFIGDVMPILFYKFLDHSDIKSCRLASKRWNKAVDHCLETNPDIIPYHSEAVTDKYFNYHPFRIITNMKIFMDEGALKKVKRNDRKHNPFPGRNVLIFVEDETWVDDPSWHDHYRRINSTVELSKVVPTIKILGHHIWHVTFSIPYISYANGESIIRRLLQPVFQCLASLPNLRSLDFMALTLPLCDLNEKSLKQIEYFQNLPFQLETLNFRIWQSGTGDRKFARDVHTHLLTAFVNHNYLKKLTFFTFYWKSEYAELFPNLVELNARVSSLPILQQVLKDLKSSPLRKLYVEVQVTKISVEEILEAIIPYPNIEYLQLGGDGLTSSVSHSLEYEILSVKHLRMGVDKLIRGYDFLFLDYLPNLEYFTVEAKRMVSSKESNFKAKTEDEDDEDPFLTSLYNLFQEKEDAPGNFSFIWTLLPELKMLTIRDLTHTYQYSRESQDSVFRTRCALH